ncbi:MAG: FecR domain-containing protein [Flavisolibacter sp.]
MPHTVFLNLIAKKLTGEASPEEIRQFESLMKANPEWAYQAEQIQSLFFARYSDSEEDSEVAFEQHLRKMQEAGLLVIPKNETPPRRRKAAIAASFILLAVLAVAFSFWISNDYKISIPQAKTVSEVISPVGSKTKLVLPDSTVVWLNAGSKLTYNEHFGATNRNTTLVGEAFFDVKKSNMPFIIHTNSLQIKVLGTAFNVKAYPDEKTTETSLLRGRVEITLDKRPGERYILMPNEKLIVANDQQEVKVKAFEKKEPIAVLRNITHVDDSTVIETSWVQNRLVFEDEPFIEVAKKMERWYGVKIAFADEKVANDHVYGSFTSETIVEALDALKIGFHFDYKIEGKNITIASK